MFARALSFASSVIFPFETNFSKFLIIPALDVSIEDSLLPLSITSNPFTANVWVIPLAIVPVPTTQIFICKSLHISFCIT